MNFPLPSFDPLLSHPGNDHLNIDAASASAVFDLAAPHTGSANSPPGEFDLDVESYQQQLAFMDGQAALHPTADQLGALLDMAELHETMEDRAQDAGIPILGEQQPSSLESFAAFVNAHPQDAMALVDPNFYANLGMQIFQQFPQLVQQFPQLANSMMPHGLPPPQYMVDPNNLSLPADFASVPQQQQQQQQHEQAAFDQAMYEMFMPQQELAMPTPIHPINVHNVSIPPTPVQTELSHSLAGTPQLQVASTPVDSAPAPAPSSARARYVPPVGAAMVGR